MSLNANELKQRLLHACKVGDSQELTNLLEANGLPSCETMNACLQCACAYGSTVVSEVLISFGAVINERSVGVDFALPATLPKTSGKAIAPRSGSKIRYSLPAFHLALQYGHYNTCDMLISHGGDINFRSSEGLTPMHVACMNGDVEGMQYLVRNKASMSLHDSKGNTPLLTSVSHGQVHPINFLLNSSDEDAGLSQQKRLQLMRYTNSINGMTILHTACSEDQLEVVDMLGAKSKFVQIVMQLIINEQDRYNKTALHYAVSQGNTKLVELLIKNFEPNLNVQDVDGNTSLHFALASKNISMISTLISAGAKTDIKNKKKFTVKDMAKKLDINLKKITSS